jgi:hypothetical protein
MTIALSWSRISDYNQCPRKFFLKYIAKGFPQEDASKSIHLVKGAEIHKQLENYTFAKINGKPPEAHMSGAVSNALPIVDKIFANYGKVWPERQVAVTYDFRPAEWFGKDVGFRAIWDISAVNVRSALILDWKTGKVQDFDQEEPGQLHLSAAMAQPLLDIDEAHIAYAYVEHKILKPAIPLKFTGEDFPHIRGFFQRTFDTVNREKDWKPRANPFCNWCPATQKQCELSRKIDLLK